MIPPPTSSFKAMIMLSQPLSVCLIACFRLEILARKQRLQNAHQSYIWEATEGISSKMWCTICLRTITCMFWKAYKLFSAQPCRIMGPLNRAIDWEWKPLRCPGWGGPFGLLPPPPPPWPSSQTQVQLIAKHWKNFPMPICAGSFLLSRSPEDFVATELNRESYCFSSNRLLQTLCSSKDSLKIIAAWETNLQRTTFNCQQERAIDFNEKLWTEASFRYL